jgi:hypothetical protein
MSADDDELARREADALAVEDELPVVARLVVEIRSDGTRTVARGAMSDVETGQSVAVELRSGSPWQMAQSLVKALLSMPKLVVNARKALGRTRG